MRRSHAGYALRCKDIGLYQIISQYISHALYKLDFTTYLPF